jgi:hypothetical protein
MRHAILASVLVGCAGPDGWEIEVRFPPDQDPLEGAERLEAVVRTPQGVSIHRFDPAAERLALTAIDPQTPIEEITLSAYFGPDRTAFGRTGPLVPSVDASPPPLYFARVRLFAPTAGAPPPGGGFAVATDFGAFVATAAGLARYEHATGEFVDGPALEGARFAAYGDGKVVGFVGTDAYALDEAGASFEHVTSLLPDTTGATLLGLTDGVLVVGPDTLWVWRPDAPLGDRLALDPPRTGAAATLLAGDENVRAVVTGGVDSAGAPLAHLVVVGIEPLSIGAETMLATPRSGHAAIEIAELRGNVFVFGGATSTGPTDSVENVIVWGSGEPEVRFPSPEPLFLPRTGVAAIGLPGGDVLLSGGQTSPPEDATVAERFRFKGGGSSVLTGELPASIPNAAAVRLFDGAILVCGDGAAAVYVPDPD